MAPFRALLEERLARLETTDRINPVQSLAQETGISYRRLFSILKDQERMSFDTADKIVTRLKGPMLWHSDPTLVRIYRTVKL